MLAFAAMMLLGQKQPEKKQNSFFDGIGDMGILGDGAKNLMNSFSKLNGDGDKTSVIMELISNPLVFNMLKNTLFKDKTKEKESDSSAPPEQTDSETVHNKGKDVSNADKDEQTANAVEKSDNAEKQADTKQKFESDGETFSEEAKDFFRPVEKIAGLEVSQELYRLYDGWYLCEKQSE